MVRHSLQIKRLRLAKHICARQTRTHMHSLKGNTSQNLTVLARTHHISQSLSTETQILSHAKQSHAAASFSWMAGPDLGLLAFAFRPTSPHSFDHMGVSLGATRQQRNLRHGARGRKPTRLRGHHYHPAIKSCDFLRAS